MPDAFAFGFTFGFTFGAGFTAWLLFAGAICGAVIWWIGRPPKRGP